MMTMMKRNNLSFFLANAKERKKERKECPFENAYPVDASPRKFVTMDVAICIFSAKICKMIKIAERSCAVWVISPEISKLLYLG